MNVILFESEILVNTGGIGRTRVATDMELHLIKPLGFKINEKAVKRAGLDYWGELDMTVYSDHQEFLKQNPGAKIRMTTTRARKVYTEVEHEPDYFLVFRKESAGIPEEVPVGNREICVRTPIRGDIRLLSLSNSMSIVLYEALRRNGFEKTTMEGDLHRLHWK